MVDLSVEYDLMCHLT